MDTEQSGEVVEVSDSPQEETETQKEVVSKVESPADTETPATTVTANGDDEQVNGHSEVEVVNDVGTEEADVKVEDDAKMEDNVPEEEPKEEPAASLSDKEGIAKDLGKDDDGNQPEQEEKKVEQAPVNETIAEPVVAQEPVETPPPKEEEKVVENVEVPKEKGEPKEEEKMVEEDKEKTEESKGEVKEKSDTVEAEVAPTAAAETAAEDGKSEVKEQEEDPTPAAGSLAFAILEQDKTKDTFKTTRTLVVLRGLPGSGKTFLARAIAEAYKDQCSILSADDHDVKPGSADGYKAFDEAIVAKCSAESPSLIVVDDTNHTQDRLAHLRGIAKQHRLVAIFLEPKTEWSRDATQLTKKTKKGLEQAKLETLKKVYEEMSIPLYFGWFLFCTVQDQVREKSTDFLKVLEGLESFKKHISDFSGKEEEKEVDLEQYFKAKRTLHCTTKFTNYGKAEGSKEYTEKQVVQDLYSSVSELSLSALFVTPRTVGARVSLSEDQLQLWPDDAEKEAESFVPGAATLPPGSRAHVTLGCADGVKPVQTGFDLLQILMLQKDGQQGEQVDIDPGTLTYYGEGRWYLALKEPICAAACFSSAYKPKAPGTGKKEKKKVKCSIL
ncbi:2',3'-cyclic-nucleotide 3'-phosphodiesterase [Boleophthalmus pectinirostris]|uniref:2',3'-cyclic-nucleotide 3'-phosphodiesterase n=1 Tax=Boleophthalmus pectinirostris TaxID=150288 RepID=UPI00242E14A4|nr:2',3'-cyclic-nucleotide 3'-phosphodiesterase [Boleophthalmus pectinirostris]